LPCPLAQRDWPASTTARHSYCATLLLNRCWLAPVFKPSSPHHQHRRILSAHSSASERASRRRYVSPRIHDATNARQFVAAHSVAPNNLVTERAISTQLPTTVRCHCIRPLGGVYSLRAISLSFSFAQKPSPSSTCASHTTGLFSCRAAASSRPSICAFVACGHHGFACTGGCRLSRHQVARLCTSQGGTSRGEWVSFFPESHKRYCPWTSVDHLDV
jgi:hypothetical protein